MDLKRFSEVLDDCILGADFLRKINLGKFFFLFGLRIVSDRVPNFLEELFLRHSENLNLEQGDIFVGFLQEFRDVFSEEGCSL